MDLREVIGNVKSYGSLKDKTLYLSALGFSTSEISDFLRANKDCVSSYVSKERRRVEEQRVIDMIRRQNAELVGRKGRIIKNESHVSGTDQDRG